MTQLSIFDYMDKSDKWEIEFWYPTWSGNDYYKATQSMQFDFPVTEKEFIDTWKSKNKFRNAIIKMTWPIDEWIK